MGFPDMVRPLCLFFFWLFIRSIAQKTIYIVVQVATSLYTPCNKSSNLKSLQFFKKYLELLAYFIVNPFNGY